MSNDNHRSMVVESDERVWPDSDLRDIARDVVESNGTWLHDDLDKLTREVWGQMLNKYGTTRYCGPTRDNGVPFTTADVRHVAHLIKGATVHLPPVPVVELTFAKYVTETYMASVSIDPEHFEREVGEPLAEASIDDIRVYCMDHNLAPSEHLTHTDEEWQDPTIVS